MLKITGYKNFFKIKGILNKKNIHQFDDTFSKVLDTDNDIVINLEGLEKIDHFGLNAIARLHNKAISKNKSLSIIGNSDNLLLG